MATTHPKSTKRNLKAAPPAAEQPRAKVPRGRGGGRKEKPEAERRPHVGARVAPDTYSLIEEDAREAGFVNARNQAPQVGKVLDLWAKERRASKERKARRNAPEKR